MLNVVALNRELETQIIYLYEIEYNYDDSY